LNQAGKFFLDCGHDLSLRVDVILPQSLFIGDWHITSW
jgi:hypothetical protein